MERKAAIEFTNYCASLVTLVNQLNRRMTVRQFLDVFSDTKHGDDEHVFGILFDLGLTTSEDWVGTKEGKGVCWVR